MFVKHMSSKGLNFIIYENYLPINNDKDNRKMDEGYEQAVVYKRENPNDS